LLDDLIPAASFSTRFSTELLKTFAQYLNFLRRAAMEWFQKCVSGIPFLFIARGWEFIFPKKNLSDAVHKPAPFIRTRTLAMIAAPLQNVPEANERPDSQRG
jgi:hypothetical protein